MLLTRNRLGLNDLQQARHEMALIFINIHTCRSWGVSVTSSRIRTRRRHGREREVYIAKYVCDYWKPKGILIPALHYSDVIMSMMASPITSVSIVYLTVCSGTDQRKHQSSASLAFVRGIHRWPVNSPHKGPVTRKMFPFDDVTMHNSNLQHHDMSTDNQELAWCQLCRHWWHGGLSLCQSPIHWGFFLYFVLFFFWTLNFTLHFQRIWFAQKG